MAEITCTRCGASGTPLERAPLPGAEGIKVRDHVCPACWREWLAMQVRLINEYRLSPADPQHYAHLLAQMKGFLNLEGV